MFIFWYLLIGIGAGIAGGLFGIGGGILIVPALIGLVGFSQQKAQGTSLVALLAPVGALALMEYWRRQELDFSAGAWIALGFFVGGLFGARFAVALDEATMRKAFAGFLMVVAIGLLLKKS